MEETSDANYHSKSKDLSNCQGYFLQLEGLALQFNLQMEITEQPISKVRYRYPCEKGSHGSVYGINSDSSSRGHKSGPKVFIKNLNELTNQFTKPEVRIKATLYTAEEKPKPHVHSLKSKRKSDREHCYCIRKVDSKSCTAEFDDIYIQRYKICEQNDILYEKLIRQYIETMPCAETETRNTEGTQLADLESIIGNKSLCEQLKDQAVKQVTTMNLNSSCICFEAEYWCEMLRKWRPLGTGPVFSNEIADMKGSKTLKIVKIDKTSGSFSGGEDMIILCEKVDKKDIGVKFYYERNGERKWETEVKAEVHHDYALYFETPAFDLPVEASSVEVSFELFRSDGVTSKSYSFSYIRNTHKKLKTENTHVNNVCGAVMKKVQSNQITSSEISDEEELYLISREFSEGLKPFKNGAQFFDYMFDLVKEDQSIGPEPDEQQSKGIKRMKTDGANLIPDSTSEVLPSDLKENIDPKAHLIRGHLNQTISVILKLITQFPLLLGMVNKDGNNVLHLLTSSMLPNSTVLIRALLKLLHGVKRSIDIKNSMNKASQTPWHLAVMTGRSDLIEVFIEDESVDKCCKDGYNNTALHLIARHDVEREMLCKLLTVLMKNPHAVNDLNNDGLSALHIAIAENRIVMVEELCKVGADVNIRCCETGNTPLHLAAKESLDIVKLLVKTKGIDLNVENNAGVTPLAIACENNRSSIADLLLNAVDSEDPVRDADSSKQTDTILESWERQKIVKYLEQENRWARLEEMLHDTHSVYFDKLTNGLSVTQKIEELLKQYKTKESLAAVLELVQFKRIEEILQENL